MRKLTIAIDCDDVLVPSAQWIVDEYKARYGVDVSLDNFYSNDPATWGVSKNQIAVKRVADILASDKYARLPPFPDAIEPVHRLSSYHDLYLVTGRTLRLESVTQLMIDTYFKGCFISMEHTSDFEGGRSKGEVCRELGIDTLIDDHTEHIESVLTVGGVREAIIFGQYPWNTHQQLTQGVVRCSDWAEVEREIERIASD